MKAIAYAITLFLLAGGGLPEAGDRPTNANHGNQATKVRFVPLAVYIDPQGRPLAAYQFEMKAIAGHVKIVGVEGGEHPAFKKPPYYDPAALAQDRIIIAAFSTNQELPRAKTRVAFVHLQVSGDVDPRYELTLTVAAEGNSQQIKATIGFQEGALQ